DAKEVRRIRQEREEELRRRLSASLDLAQQLGISGTPFFVIYDPSEGDWDVMPGYNEAMFSDMIAAVKG
ncbi:MAG: hypothetical protein V2I43_05790, partial [Parvularcula sp.]|nr:hypothetical protein [Parvularcula sp.]